MQRNWVYSSSAWHICFAILRIYMTHFKAILFDHDGTLVDSEGIHHSLWRQILPEYNINLLEAEYIKYFVGVPCLPSAIALVERHALAVTAQKLAHQKETLTSAYLSDKAFPLMPGASEALALTKALGLQLGVVTGAGSDGICATLREYGWTDKFDTVVTGSDVANSKPAPDVYQLALAKLNLMPDQAVAIEDTATGVKAAKAAGLICLAVPQRHSMNQDFSAADVVVRSIVDAVDWVRNQQSAKPT
jgi:HAD superfamily hydrolase (TIGR01509 family)